MKTKLISLFLALTMLFALAACNNKGGGEQNTPSSTPEQTNAAVPTDAPSATPAVEKNIVFINELGTGIEGVFISSNDVCEWKDPLNEACVPAGSSLVLAFDDFSGIDGSVYDFGVYDENGVNYDCYGVTLRYGDRITLSGDGKEAKFTFIRADGATETFAADIRESEPGKEETKKRFTMNVNWQYGYDMDTYAQLAVSSLELGDADKEEYPELKKSLAAATAERSEKASAAFEELKRSLRNSEPYEFACLEEGTYLRRCDEKMISALYVRMVTVDSKADYSYYSDNIERATGKRLMLSDVVNDVSRLPALLNELLEKRNEDGFMLDPEVDYTERFSAPSDDFAWLMDPHGITFMFNEGAFGIEDAHPLSVTLAFRDNPGLVRDEFFPKAENFAMYMPRGTDSYIELNGKLVSLLLSEAQAAEEEIKEEIETQTTVRIFIDGEMYEDSLNAWTGDPIYLHAAGRDYIYICNSHGEANEPSLIIYEITDGSVKKLKELDNVRPGGIIIDPTEFTLASRLFLIGDTFGMRRYSVGADGVPTTADTLYTNENPPEYTLLRDVTAEKLDEFGEPTGETVTLKTGEKYRYYITDGKSFGDFLSEDGRLFRIKVDDGKVEGEELYEVFSDIQFWN